MTSFLRSAPIALFLASFVALVHCSDQENPDNPPFGDAGPPLDVANDVDSVPPKPEQPHSNKNPQPKVVECSRGPLAKPSSGTCTVAKSGTGGVILQGTVLAPEETLRRGEVLIDSAGIIQCVGCDCAAHPLYAAASQVVCADGVISPGLINPHEHLTYQNNKPISHGAERYENRSDWQGARGHTRLDYKSGANQTVQAYGELRFLMSGTTAIAGGGGVPGLIRNVDTSPEDLEGAPLQPANSDVFPLSTPGKNLTGSCDYSSGRTTAASVSQLQSYLPHISEGIDAEAHNEILCTKDGQFDLVGEKTAIIHAAAIGVDEAKLFQAERSKVVWSPRSNIDLYGNTAPVVMLDIAGVNVSLGTDWVPSGSMNTLRELRCADSLNKKYFDNHFTDADLWRMSTINAAFAVGAAHAIGKLATGYLGDIAIFDGATSKDHRAVLDAGVEDVVLVLRGGKAMYGDDALVRDAIFGGGTGCAAIGPDVCGKAKTACVDARIGGASPPDLAAIRAAGEVYYPLFFCKNVTPTDEPTCVPSRDGSVKRSTVYKGEVTPEDLDGDGIPNARDNCPKVWNPIRPMDEDRQPDADKDGIGDACDECPFDAAQGCSRATGGDFDGDGVPNGTDNCPFTTNPGQADGDGDGRGDACDACAAANPGASPCPVAISTLRNPAAPGHPDKPTVVRVRGFVSARKTGDLFYVQEAATSAPWQGIYVPAGALTGTAATGALVGNEVTVTGLYSEVFNVSQIVAATVVRETTTATTMTPLAVSVSQINTAAGAAAEPYESLLVRIDDGGVPGGLAITNDNPDTGPFFEIVVTGNLRLDDFIVPRYGTPATCTPSPCAYPPPTLTNGRAFTSITGIGGFSFGNRKLYPRTASATGDIQPPP
ncbi:MAG: amidohydrolase family protein [Deltaproteobacteria bacterium]|nr:amidohydrolase family protein [Deltaproteobacteria bacterium]